MPAPVGYAEVSHYFTGIGVPRGAAVVYGVDQAAGHTALSVADAARIRFAQHIMPILSAGVTLSRTLVKLGPPATGASAETSAQPQAGGDSAITGTPNQSYLATKNTDLGGRRGKGRLYFPGVTEASVNEGGLVLASKITAQQTAYTAWLAGLNTDLIPMVLLHGPTHYWILVDGRPRQVPDVPYSGAPDLVTSITPSSRIATQRRRLR